MLIASLIRADLGERQAQAGGARLGMDGPFSECMLIASLLRWLASGWTGQSLSAC